LKAKKGAIDLLFFAKEILGFKDIEKSVHGKLCQKLQDFSKKKKLILLPRGSFKTSISTVSFPIWCLIHNPNLRILIDSEVYDNSKNYLKAIRLIYETNKEFRLLYGNYVSKRGWLEESLTIRKRTVIFKEPSIDIGSLDTVKVGMHYDIIIMDDIVSDKNIQTKEQRLKVIDHYKLILSILEPNGLLIICGTRWHWIDLYAYIIEENKHLSQTQKFDIYIESAIKENGELFFPNRLTKEFLDEQLAKQGSAIFNAQYKNSPTNIENAYFKNVNYYSSWMEVPKDLYIVEVCDPAISEKETADFTATIVAGVDKLNNIWVLDYFNKHSNPYDTIKDMLIMRQRWHPHTIGIETNLFQKVLKYILEQQEAKAGVLLPIEELKHTKQSKEMRILALQPFFEQGKIFVRKDMTELLDQIWTYPKCKNDDLIDALSMVIELARTPWKEGQLTQEEELLEQKPWLRRKKRVPAMDEILGTEW